jgi:predicted amino acid dehydrogenase
LKYQTSGKSIPTIEENWQTLKNQNMNTLLKSSVSKDAFTTQDTLYVYENKQIITVSSSLGNAIQEQIVKELL